MVSDFCSSLNDLSVKAGVYLSVCISSKVCLHRYLNSLIHQSCAVWTSQPRSQDTNWRTEANQRCTDAHATFTHIRPSGDTSPALSWRSRCWITFDIYTLLKDVVLLHMQPELFSRTCSEDENLHYSTPLGSEQIHRPAQENNGFLERMQMENEQWC